MATIRKVSPGVYKVNPPTGGDVYKPEPIGNPGDSLRKAYEERMHQMKQPAKPGSSTASKKPAPAPKKTEAVREFIDSTGKPVGWSKGADTTGWKMNPAYKSILPWTRKR